MFMDVLKQTLNEEFNESVTENGAKGYRTTGKELLDMNFQVSSMRNMSELQIEEKFIKAFYENPRLAVKWLFYVRDAREGVGERRLFRACLKYLAHNRQDIVVNIIPLIPEYGRWDDLWCLLGTSFGSTVQSAVFQLVTKQLTEDMINMKENKPISLLAKWMPSCNTSSEETMRLAAIMMKGLGFTKERPYRKMLSKLRAYLKVVEVDMSAGRWDSIDYSAVPSRANLLYNSAFLKNDEKRRRAYLESLQKGETKINAGVLFPHDIVHKYSTRPFSKDVTLEELWKALPDYVNGSGNTICVADGSGSMTNNVGRTRVTALEVANALAIYFSERSSGQFKDQYITFSENPQLVDFHNAKTLQEKIRIARSHNEVANTNIEAVFDLILTTAVKKRMRQDELPQNILILSDMEFDDCACVQGQMETYIDWFGRPRTRMTQVKPTGKLFDIFAKRYAEHGYKLPRLVFWNICGRTGTIPVKENDLGVALVSGFSPAIAKMVLSNSTDPFECLLEQLNSPRYDAVDKALVV